MKSETQIAEENIGFIKSNVFSNEELGKEHKASCERFLEFLKEEMKKWELNNKVFGTYISTGELEEKIQDLKDAIKKYDEAGI